MLKNHELHTAVINHIAVSYFYTKEKRDINGNSRFRVHILDPDAPAVYETIFKCYECQIKEHVIMFIEGAEK
ncbi:MAG: hypothetical protein ACI4IW_06475 [Oscillospiraceae bacterium]